MTDYEIQKATADKVGVVSPPDNIYECRKAILEKLGGDSTNADTIYECDKRILPLIGSGSANLQSKSVDITENGNTTYSPDSGFDGFSDFSVNVNVPSTPTQSKEVTITENKTETITPDSGYNLSSVNVTVDVPPTPVQVKSVNITENGTTSVLPDLGYNLSKVDITVNVNAQGSLKLTNGTKLGGSTFTVLPDYDFSDITDMSGMFSNCYNLTSVPLFDTINVTNMSSMFYGCASITSVPEMNTSKVMNMPDMFYNCSSLTSIPQLDTNKLTDMSNMFSNCSSLTSIPQMYTGRVRNISHMFYNCNKITDLGGFVNLGKLFRLSQTLDLSYSPLTNQSVQNIIDTVFDMNQNTKGGSATLILSQSVIDAMTDEQKSQLAAKGWTLTNSL